MIHKRLFIKKKNSKKILQKSLLKSSAFKFLFQQFFITFLMSSIFCPLQVSIPWPDTFAVFVSANIHGQVWKFKLHWIFTDGNYRTNNFFFYCHRYNVIKKREWKLYLLTICSIICNDFFFVFIFIAYKKNIWIVCKMENISFEIAVSH